MGDVDNIYKYIFEQILKMTDDGFIVVDNQGIITDINRQYSEFLGVKRENAIGHNIKKFIPNSKMIQCTKERFAEEGVVHTYVSGKSKNEKVIVSRSYVEDENNQVVAGVAQVKFELQSLDVAKRLLAEYEELKYYKEQYNNANASQYSFDNIVGSTSKFIGKKIEGIKAAKTDFSVLLTGETGTGKEVFAKAIHNSSLRAHKPMVSINCAAIPEALLESELFGYEDGAFTGAKRGGKKGKFFIANGGTIFLDEIGDMPMHMQAKLLRVLQEKEIEPVGSIESIPIDVRVISATRKDLPKMISNGEFREDLYYRLNVINIEMIPLRGRADDILEIAIYFLDKLNTEYHTLKVFSSEVKNRFKHYNWPGNIRELDNVIKSAYAISNDIQIELSDLPEKISKCEMKEDDLGSMNLKERVEEYEKKLLMEILLKTNWKCHKVADSTGYHRSVIYKKMKKYGISKENYMYSHD